MVLFLFFIGLAVGSFLNVLIDRLPNGESVLIGRSHCDFCKKTLRWYELLPVISWIMQGGKCRRCHKRLSIQYPLIELVTAVGFIFLYQLLASSMLSLFAYALIFSSLLVIFVADFKYQIIPDSMIAAGILGALLVLFFPMNHKLFIMNYIFSAVGASLFFLTLWFITRGRGMGFGDVKLAFLLGLLLGFPRIIVAFYIAFLTGALVGVILILSGKKSLKSNVPFGPFLILGAVAALQWTTYVIGILGIPW